MKKHTTIIKLILLLSFAFLTSCNGTAKIGGTLSKSYDCGNSTLEVGEQCDDGNLISGDGCDDSCRNEIIPSTTKTVELDQSDCGTTFSESGVLYQLTENIDCPGTAFAFTRGNIVFDGGNHTITYGTAGGNNPGLAITEWNVSNVIFRSFHLKQHENATGGNGIHSSFEPGRVKISNVTIEGGVGMTDWHSIGFNSGTGSQLIDVIAYSHSTETTNRHSFTGRNIYLSGRDILVDRVIGVGGSQNAIVTGHGWLVRHSYFAAGGLQENETPIAKTTNDFAVTGWQVQGTDLVNIVVVNTHHNVIQENVQDYISGSKTIDELLIYHQDMSDPNKMPIALIPHQEGRGVGYGGNTSTSGFRLLDSVVFAESSATNSEYSGCALGGSYALQLENTIDSEIGRSVIVGNGSECEAHALRVGGASGTFTNTIVTNNIFRAAGGLEDSGYSSVFKFAQGVELNISQNTAILQGLSRLFYMDGNSVDGLTFNTTHVDCSEYDPGADNRLFVTRTWDGSSNVPHDADIYFNGTTFEDTNCENLIMNNLGFWNDWNGTTVDNVIAHFDD